jgi:hypothetical protein
LHDARGRFREIACAVLEARRDSLPDARPCEDALTRFGNEPDGTRRHVDLAPSRRQLVAVVVPGIGSDCISNWLDGGETLSSSLGPSGFDVRVVTVEGLSSSIRNARLVREAIMAFPDAGGSPRLVLIGYSKGASDILEAIVTYPEIRPRVAAVVSFAGAIAGSPLAEDVTQKQLEMLRHWPDAECPPGDGGGIDSLRPDNRRAWLAEHQLPRTLPYYSLVTCPDPERVSSVLRPGFSRLWRDGGPNDGMVLVRDQAVPDSTWLACLNADHWAVAVPIARTHPTLAATFVDHNDYPREALLEAVLRFVEEDLDGRSRRASSDGP